MAIGVCADDVDWVEYATPAAKYEVCTLGRRADEIKTHLDFFAVPNLTNPWQPGKGIDFDSPATKFWVINHIKQRLQDARKEKKRIGGWLVRPTPQEVKDGWSPSFAITSGMSTPLQRLLPFVVDIQVYQGVKFVKTVVEQQVTGMGETQTVTYDIRGEEDPIPEKFPTWAIRLCSLVKPEEVKKSVTIHGYNTDDVADLGAEFELQVTHTNQVLINTDVSICTPKHLRNVLFGAAAEEQSSNMDDSVGPDYRAFRLGHVFGKDDQKFRTHLINITDEQLQQVQNELERMPHMLLDPEKPLYSVEHQPQWHQDPAQRELKQTADSVHQDVMELHSAEIKRIVKKNKFTVIIELEIHYPRLHTYTHSLLL